jgi:hypothetical protein
MIIEMQTITSVDENGTNMNHSFDVKQTVNENFSDFHLFCLSVVRDLINNQSHINGEPFIYDFNFTPDEDDEDDNEGEEWKEKGLEPEMPGYLQETMSVLSYMSDVIFRERDTFNKELENLLK